MTTQVFPLLTTMHTSLSTQFTQCLGSQTLGQEMVQKLDFNKFHDIHTRTRPRTHTRACVRADTLIHTRTHTHAHTHTHATHMHTHTHKRELLTHSEFT